MLEETTEEKEKKKELIFYSWLPDIIKKGQLINAKSSQEKK